MIITEQKPFEEILKALEGKRAVFLVGCGECAATCKTGGETEVSQMVERLHKEGKVVTGWVVPEAPCIAAQVKVAFAKNRKEITQADCILVLACGSGVQSVKENDRLGKSVYPACNSLFGAIVDSEGNFLERCSNCGECVLTLTEGICPITLCPKGLLNGPCGGTDKGKCEVDKERDCAWTLIYNELAKKGKLDLMREIQPPKDYSLNVKPRKLILNEKIETERLNKT